MKNDRAIIERRGGKRFRLKPGTVALLVRDWPHSTIVGNILDISTNGVAVQYVSDEPLPEAPCELGIATTESYYYLGKLQVEAVSDFAMTKIPFGSLVPRRLGLQFRPLSSGQSSDLESYIKDNARAPV